MTETIIHTKSDMWALCERLTEMDLTKPLAVTVKKYKRQRSGQQNKYYWSALEIISKETGDDVDSLHTYFRRKFLAPVEKTVMGQKVLCLRSTTDLNTAEFVEYMDRIIAEVAPFGIAIPIPGDMAA